MLKSIRSTISCRGLRPGSAFSWLCCMWTGYLLIALLCKWNEIMCIERSVCLVPSERTIHCSHYNHFPLPICLHRSTFILALSAVDFLWHDSLRYIEEKDVMSWFFDSETVYSAPFWGTSSLGCILTDSGLACSALADEILCSSKLCREESLRSSLHLSRTQGAKMYPPSGISTKSFPTKVYFTLPSDLSIDHQGYVTSAQVF